MANTSSARKAIRVSEKKALKNLRARGEMRSSIKEFRQLITLGDIESAENKLSEVSSSIDQAAKKNIIKKNTASRYKSRIANLLNNSK